ncbi:PepSY1/2 domain-containing protein [Lysinibacillus sp. KU-BSD001]|uniref:PepSY1/2 domain-containing protein n=1 Tax=Lysinibacillus sp. KU-BSD001 TaxID=3141328 RepID=UPI0036E0F767
MKNTLYLLGILSFALVLYTIHLSQENGELKQAVHAQYTSELASASEKLNNLSKTVLQAQLFQDEQARSEEMDSIWRLSNELRNSITKLPIQSEVASELLSYLGKMGEQAKRGTEADWEGISQNMKMLSEDWTVATARYFAADSDYNTWQDHVLDEVNSPFKQVSTTVKSYREANFPITASESDYQKKRELAHITDKDVTKEQAVNRVQELFPTIDGATLTVSMNADDAAYPFYHIQFVRGSRLGYADVTKKGGHLLSFLLERPVNEQSISQQQARDTATQFLKQAGFTDVVYTEARENHEAWHFVFTRQAGDALVYPDSIQLKIAKDNGEVLGANTMEYIQKETIPDTKPTPLNADEYFTDRVTVEDTKLVYTENAGYELVLCYEMTVRVNNDTNDTFRVLIDANTHDVIQTEKLI